MFNRLSHVLVEILADMEEVCIVVQMKIAAASNELQLN